MNLTNISLALWVVSFFSSVYSFIANSFTALIVGILFALAGIAQEQFNNWGK